MTGLCRIVLGLGLDLAGTAPGWDWTEVRLDWTRTGLGPCSEMLTLPLKNWTGTELDQTVTGLDYTGTGTGLGWIGTGLELPSAHLANNTEIVHV